MYTECLRRAYKSYLLHIIFGAIVLVFLYYLLTYFPFAAIGNAYAVLSNPEKRQQYDQYGEQGATESASHSSAHPRYTHTHHRTFHRDFEADISPEELFNIFFGGRFPTG